MLKALVAFLTHVTLQDVTSRLKILLEFVILAVPDILFVQAMSLAKSNSRWLSYHKNPRPSYFFLAAPNLWDPPWGGSQWYDLGRGSHMCGAFTQVSDSLLTVVFG